MVTNTAKETMTVADARARLDAVIEHAQKTKRPVILTKDGNAAVVILDAAQYQKEMDERETYLAVARGLSSSNMYTIEEIASELDAILTDDESEKEAIRRDMLESEADIRAGRVYKTEEIDAHIEAVLNEAE
jgi:prevent-host-death family protein